MMFIAIKVNLNFDKHRSCFFTPKLNCVIENKRRQVVTQDFFRKDVSSLDNGVSETLRHHDAIEGFGEGFVVLGDFFVLFWSLESRRRGYV